VDVTVDDPREEILSRQIDDPVGSAEFRWAGYRRDGSVGHTDGDVGLDPIRGHDSPVFEFGVESHGDQSRRPWMYLWSRLAAIPWVPTETTSTDTQPELPHS